MAEARRWLTSIVGHSVDLNTPQAASATQRFLGHQWLSLAGERNQVAREREAERKLDRAQRAVAAARRSRLAREAAFEVWEDVDNYEESFGTEMENVVFDEDLKTGVRVRSKKNTRIYKNFSLYLPTMQFAKWSQATDLQPIVQCKFSFFSLVGEGPVTCAAILMYNRRML